MQYRPEVDGLRAVAVLPVILFHAGFSAFSGGFVGVDVFFVISGYLITTIINKEMAQGRFSMWRFYERRARRILPALFVVCLASLYFAWLWMLPNEFKDFSQSLVGVATFTSNILFWRESGYFAGPAELKPLLHTWSLAVEEQFYILYPPLLIALYRFVPKQLFLVVSLGVLASLSLAQYASTAHPGANFYLLPSRAWELGVGALVALYLNQPTRAPQSRRLSPDSALARLIRESAGLLGLALIAYSIFAFDETTPFPSLWTLIPVLGTALIILAADRGNLAGRLLGLRSLVFIGLLSYSAYLWHQPLFAFARIRTLEGIPTWLYWSLIALTFVLAWLTWKTIETPARKRITLPRGQVLSGAIGACLVVGVIGGLGWANQGHTSRNADAAGLAAWKDSRSPYRDACHTPDSPETACVLGEGDQSPFYIWSDSHGVELAWQLSQELTPSMMPVKSLTYSGCQPVIGVYRPGEKKCRENNISAFSYLTNDVKPSTVLLAARWPYSIDGSIFNNGEGGVEAGSNAALFPSGWDGGTDENRIDQVGQAIGETVAGLLQAGHRVILVYPVPEVGWDVPLHLARSSLLGLESSAPLSTSHQVYLKRSANTRAQLDAITQDDKLLRIRPAELFCDNFISERCIAQLPDGRPLYFDDDHPNEVGARIIAEDVLRGMRAEGWLPIQPLGSIASHNVQQ